MQEVTQFNPSSFMDGVKERIKATFVGLIPESQWDALVKREIDAFFEPGTLQFEAKDVPVDGKSWQTKRVWVATEPASQFRLMVWEEVANRTREVLRTNLLKEYYNNVLDAQPEMGAEKMKELVTACVPTVMNNFFQHLVWEASKSAQHTILNHRQ